MPMPTISLGRCLADPNLFASHFRNKSWAGWKTFLRALVCRGSGPDDLEIYRARTGRTAWPTEPFTEAATIVGRRGGKSRVLALIAVYLAASATMRRISPRARWRRSGCWRSTRGKRGRSSGLCLGC